MSTSNKATKHKKGVGGKKAGGIRSTKSAMVARTISFPEPKRSSLKVFQRYYI